MSTLKVDGIRSNSATSDAITLADNGTCTANITNNLSNRNLIINGAMQVAQRGTSSTSQGYQTVDRFAVWFSGTDEAPTQAQVDVASGTTPYTSGFRKALKVTNGNQTSGAGASDYVFIRYKVEAQDLANSGWDYTNSNSFITLSFWVKASVAQTYNFRLETSDGTGQNFPFQYALSADTWTKITKTIPGNSNLQFNNDSGTGFELHWQMYRGTDFTDNSVANDTWAAYASGTRTKDATSTWYTTNDATFEITGVQLEVGDSATDFEHRSYAQELPLCQRYYQILAKGPNKYWHGVASNYTATQLYMPIQFTTEMRATPTLEFTEGSAYYQIYDSGNTGGVNVTRPQSFSYADERGGALYIGASYVSGLTVGDASLWYAANASALIAVGAEL
jgi:hypothetical protein